MPTRRGSDRTDLTDNVLGLVHDTLDGAVTHDGRNVPHREHPEEALSPPYYTSGPSDMEPARVQTSSSYGGAQTVAVQIDTWSAYHGKKEVSALQEKALVTFYNTSLTLGGGLNLTQYRVVRTRIQGEPNESKMNYHGIAVLAFRVQLPTA